MTTDYAAQKAAIDVLDLPLEHVDPNPLNTRKKYDQVALEELAASIKSLGLLQRVIARPKDGRFELIIGERRRRAALLAGLAMIRAEVWHDVDDETAVEMIIVENSQRADVAPIEEADGFLYLHEKRNLTFEEIARKTGKSARLVYYRVKLARNLKEPARQALADGLILQQTADALALIDDEARQGEALEDVLPPWQYDGATGKEVRGAALPWAKAKPRIERFLAVPLDQAPFDLADPTLVRGCGGGDGSCNACPMRTTVQPALFSGVVDGDVCTNRDGYEQKVAAHRLRQLDEAKKRGLKVLSAKAAAVAFVRGGLHDTTAPGGEWVKASEHVIDYDRESPTWAAAFGDKLPKPTHAALGPSGNVVELYRSKDLIGLAKREGISLERPRPEPQDEARENAAAAPRAAPSMPRSSPKRAPAAPSGPSAARQAEQAEAQRKRELEFKIEDAVALRQVEELVANAEKASNGPKFWKPLVEAAIRHIAASSYGPGRSIAERRLKLKHGNDVEGALLAASRRMNDRQRAGLLVELLNAEYRDGVGGEAAEYFSAFGVETRAIELAVRAELDRRQRRRRRRNRRARPRRRSRPRRPASSRCPPPRPPTGTRPRCARKTARCPGRGTAARCTASARSTTSSTWATSRTAAARTARRSRCSSRAPAPPTRTAPSGASRRPRRRGGRSVSAAPRSAARQLRP
jgi:ParB/RepB/Spo0J family partition protein